MAILYIGLEKDFRIGSSYGLRKIILLDGQTGIINGKMMYAENDCESSRAAMTSICLYMSLNPYKIY